MIVLNEKQLNELGYVNLEEIENECYGMINSIFDKKQSKKIKVNDIAEVIRILSNILYNINNKN